MQLVHLIHAIGDKLPKLSGKNNSIEMHPMKHSHQNVIISQILNGNT